MGRKSTTTSYGLRRRSSDISVGVELCMECYDDALTPSQVEANKRAREEYRRAMKMIDAAKAGTLPPATLPLATAATGNIMTTPTTTPDIIIVGETPPRTSVANQKRTPPAPHSAPLRQLPPALLQPQAPLPPPLMMPANAQLVAASNAGVPSNNQVFRFVNYNPAQGAIMTHSNQWVLRHLVPTSPRQQTPRQQTPSPKGNRIMASAPTNVPSIVSGTSGLGIKRPFDAPDSLTFASPVMKKPKKLVPTETDGSGNWVPLDEYYYGKMEGDPTYIEEKQEHRYKCWLCTKMLYNNVKAMMHLQGHIDSEKQQNLDLSDLTQCKHCYKQFDTPFEMQTHIEKVHMNNVNVLMCRICEKDHDSRSALTAHMRQNHCACEMPYVCQLCNFRSSMYSDVVDHYKKRHDSSDSLLCLYCLRVFHVKFVSQGWGQTQAYYHHLLRHQSRTNNRKCTFCKLSFFSPQDLKAHRKNNHQSNQKGVIGANAKYSTPDQVMIKVPETGLKPKKSSGPMSLNAPAVSKVTEHRGLQMPRLAATVHCFECKMLMSTSDHYKKYIQCSMCRFATSCSFAYASHMMGFHSGQVSSLSQNVAWERPMAAPLYCQCGFTSKFGNRIANHLVFCSKRTCFFEKPEFLLTDKTVGQDEEKDPRRKPDASILDVLGLVKKRSLVSTNGQLNARSRRFRQDMQQVNTDNLEALKQEGETSLPESSRGDRNGNGKLENCNLRQKRKASVQGLEKGAEGRKAGDIGDQHSGEEKGLVGTKANDDTGSQHSDEEDINRHLKEKSEAFDEKASEDFSRVESSIEKVKEKMKKQNSIREPQNVDSIARHEDGCTDINDDMHPVSTADRSVDNDDEDNDIQNDNTANKQPDSTGDISVDKDKDRDDIQNDDSAEKQPDIMADSILSDDDDNSGIQYDNKIKNHSIEDLSQGDAFRENCDLPSPEEKSLCSQNIDGGAKTLPCQVTANINTELRPAGTLPSDAVFVATANIETVQCRSAESSIIENMASQNLLELKEGTSKVVSNSLNKEDVEENIEKEKEDEENIEKEKEDEENIEKEKEDEENIEKEKEDEENIEKEADNVEDVKKENEADIEKENDKEVDDNENTQKEVEKENIDKEIDNNKNIEVTPVNSNEAHHHLDNINIGEALPGDSAEDKCTSKQKKSDDSYENTHIPDEEKIEDSYKNSIKTQEEKSEDNADDTDVAYGTKLDSNSPNTRSKVNIIAEAEITSTNQHDQDSSHAMKDCVQQEKDITDRISTKSELERKSVDEFTLRTAGIEEIGDDRREKGGTTRSDSASDSHSGSDVHWREKNSSRIPDLHDRSNDRRQDNPSSHSDRHDRDRNYSRDRYDRDYSYDRRHDRYQDRKQDQRYDSHHSRNPPYQQGNFHARDRSYDQSRQRNRGQGYKDRSYHRGYY